MHENPAHAHSWKLSCIDEVMHLPGVARIDGDQCQYGQASIHGDPIRKPTGWMSNSPRILEQLGDRCYGRGGRCTRREGGRHQLCSSSHARRAAVYPFELCRAILTGFRNQLRDDERHVVGMVGILPRPDAEMTMGQLQRRVHRLLGVQVEEELESEEEHSDGKTKVGADLAEAGARPTGAAHDLDLLDAKGV